MSTKQFRDEAPVALEIEGWTAKYIGGEPRLSEQVELFRELGFEVRLEPFDTEKCGGCTECFKGSPTPIYVLYVRKAGMHVAAADTLF
jgi:hypothetical protein